MSTSVSLHDEDEYKDAVADVRADSTDTKWALFGHYDNKPNELSLVSRGTGGPEEMASYMDDSQFMYGLVRLVQAFDMSTTVKFVYVMLGGKDVPFVKRGKFGVVQGAIEALFSPYHVVVEVDSSEDVTSELIETKLQETSGTKNKVLEASEAKVRQERGFTSGTTTRADSTGNTPTKRSHMVGIGKAGSSFDGVSGRAKGSGVVILQEVKDAVADVISNTTETSWCVAGYEGANVKKPIILLGSGTGSGAGIVEDVKALCPENHVVYAYIRMTDIVDDIPTVKFVYIQWVPDATKIMTKGQVSTHKGDVEDVFNPAHVTIYASASSELTHRLLSDKIAAASGSKKSHVK